ncbi:D-sedoheptulose 7-phosphate isomerase [Bradyrhizobium sp. URHC0002]
MGDQSKGPISIHLDQSLAALERAAKDPALLAVADQITGAMLSALRADNKILVIGNGGSAGDAQHIAAELVGRYKKERMAFPAIALTTDTSALTAIGNDYSFDHVFVRQVEALGRRGDLLLALSTSGRSPNILAALKIARERGLVTVGFTGARGEPMRAACDHLLMVPSDDTPIIQQIYFTYAHAICDEVEQVMAREASR